MDKHAFHRLASFLLQSSDFLSNCYCFNCILSTANINLSQSIVLLVIAISQWSLNDFEFESSLDFSMI